MPARVEHLAMTTRRNYRAPAILTAVALLVCLPAGRASAQAPVIASADPAKVEVIAGGGRTGGGLVIVTLRGTSLDRLTGARVVFGGRTLTGVVATLGPGTTARFASIIADASASAGTGRLELIASTGLVVPSPTVDVTVVARPLEALKLEGLELSAASMAPGETIQGTVRLSGAAPKDGVVVALISASENLSVPSSVRIPAGEKSATFDVAARVTGKASTAALEARYGGVSRTASVTLLTLPDLKALSCSLYPTEILTTESTRATLVYTNTGSADAVVNTANEVWSLAVAGFASTPPTTASYRESPGVVDRIRQNDHRSPRLESGPIQRPPGFYSVTATVDPQNRVAESDENNNTVTCGDLTVDQPNAYPDLVITEVVINPPNPSGESDFVVDVTILNQGDAIATFTEPGVTVLSGDPHVDPLVTGNLYAFQRLRQIALAPGGSERLRMYTTPEGRLPGVATWTIIVDPTDAIEEMYENNNEFTRTVTVQ